MARQTNRGHAQASVLASALAALALLRTSPGVAGDLNLAMYPNSAMVGPSTNVSIPSLEVSQTFPDSVGSAELTGTLTYPATAQYAYNCTFPQDYLVFVWIADHLVCHTDPPFTNTPSSTDGCPEYPLPGAKGEVVTVVVHIYSKESTATDADTHTRDDDGSTAHISVQWAALQAPMQAGATPPTQPIPVSAFSAELPGPEIQRRALQNGLKVGWSLWSYNMLGVVRLPDSSVLTTMLCRLSTQKCLTATHIEDSSVTIRVGVFAADSSYWQYYLDFDGLNISLSFGGGTEPLSGLIEPLGCSDAGVNCSDYALVATARFAWFRRGTVAADASRGALTFSPLGLPSRTVTMTTPGDTSIPLPSSITKGATYLAVKLTAAVGFEEAASAPSVPHVESTIGEARSKEYATYSKFGALANVAEAVQAAVMWNYIYHPAEYGPLLPVSRQWDFVKGPVNLDWGYVVFDWDNYFASYMASVSSKEIAYSNLIQVTRSRTARGFVPNFSAGGSKSVDRTEPPIGAKVLLQLYNKFKDEWIVELLYDDLRRWNDWYVASRMFGPLGIVSLGSDIISGYKDFAAGQMQGARFESGLDNSPMYDGEFYQIGFNQQGNFSTGQMQLYDVGFASMFVSEAMSLATLAKVIGRDDEVATMTARAASQRALISKHLWDDEGSIFTNLFWNNTFYRRISPTSFYSMMAGAASDTQATQMVQKWLQSPEHFCVAADGDFKGNHDDCYWGLPSIQRSDPAFPPLGYWRGYVWGPMAQLTYWSLQEYDHVPAVKSARKALCKQMTSLMLSQWTEHRHICENYSPHKTADDHHGDCSGTKFYHWGALTGLITLIEDGYYN